ncbi:MAG: hypothetical protein AAFR28_03570 [Pseudomonadota bacterium]
MSAHGGVRSGAGRKKGGKNKILDEAERAAHASEGITPLEYMLSVLRDESNDVAQRLDAAKAAAPYMHAKLSTVEVRGDADKPVATTMKVEIVRSSAPVDPDR